MRVRVDGAESIDYVAVALAVLAVVCAVASIVFAWWHAKEAKRLAAATQRLLDAVDKGIIVPVDVIVLDAEQMEQVRAQFVSAHGPILGFDGPV